MKRGRDVKARQKSVQRRLDRAAHFEWGAKSSVILASVHYAEKNMLFRFQNRTIKISKRFHTDADKWFRQCEGVA